MILPIYAYGHPVLKRRASDIDRDYPGLDELIRDMWETMYNARGVGLAAPQIGRSIRLFVVDTEQLSKEDKEETETGIKKVFINAEILDEEGDFWDYEEGCLSIPDIHGDVARQESLRIRYMDGDFHEKEETYTGHNARVIQHEYDHIEGILFTELLKPLKKRRIQRRLDDIRKGRVKAAYRMKFA
jgi:peptide deformylase